MHSSASYYKLPSLFFPPVQANFLLKYLDIVSFYSWLPPRPILCLHLQIILCGRFFYKWEYDVFEMNKVGRNLASKEF